MSRWELSNCCSECDTDEVITPTRPNVYEVISPTKPDADEVITPTGPDSHEVITPTRLDTDGGYLQSGLRMAK